MTMTVMETSKWLILRIISLLMSCWGKLALLRLDMIIMGVLLERKGQTIIPPH